MERVKSISGCILMAMALLSACAPSQNQIAYNQERAKVQQVVDRLVGHEYWLAFGHQLAVYEKPNWPVNTRMGEGKLTFDSLFVCNNDKCTFHVTFPVTGISGYITDDVFRLEQLLSVERPEPTPLPQVRTFYPSFLDHLKPAEAARRRALPGVALGMRMGQSVFSAWGEPLRKSQIDSRKHYREIWFYPEGNELHFEDGRLVEIKN